MFNLFPKEYSTNFEITKYIVNKNNHFFQPDHSPATIKRKCQTMTYFNKSKTSAVSEKQGQRKISLKLKSKCDTQTENQKNVSQRKFSLKSVSSGGRRLARGRHHLSCPDLSLKLRVDKEMVDCLDENTRDNIEHDGVGSELKEKYAE